MSKEEKPERLISPEPWVLLLLRKRKKIFLAGLRNSTLNFLIDVCRRLRDRDSWVESAAAVTQTTVISMIVQRMLSRVIG